MREALKECKDWIEHWQNDKAAGVPPTDFSLDRLHAIVVAALSALVEDQPVADSEWHRSNNAMGGVLLYTLREDGRRRGEPLMVNDVTVRIERAAGSEADIEPVVQRIRSALAPAPAGEDVEVMREEIAKMKAALEKISSPTQSTDLLWWQVEARTALAPTGTAPRPADGGENCAGGVASGDYTKPASDYNSTAGLIGNSTADAPETKGGEND